MTISPLLTFLQGIQRDKNKNLVKTGILSEAAFARKNVLDLNIVVGVDVSGSISSSQFKIFMSEMEAIRGVSRIKVIEVDADIVSMYNYITGKPRGVAKLGGGGGTVFGPTISKIKKMKPDGVLFMTDGFVADANSVADPGVPFAWVLTKDGKRPYRFGEIVKYV